MVGETLLIGLGVMVLTQLVKKHIQPKYGTLGIHLFVLLIAVLIGLGQYWFQYLPVQTIEMIASIWATAVGAYEILIKNFERVKT